VNDTAPVNVIEKDRPRWAEADDLLDRINAELSERRRQIEMQIDQLVGERNAIDSVLQRIGPSSPKGVMTAPAPSNTGYGQPIGAHSPIERRF
jgi:hypothetical protein